MRAGEPWGVWWKLTFARSTGNQTSSPSDQAISSSSPNDTSRPFQTSPMKYLPVSEGVYLASLAHCVEVGRLDSWTQRWSLSFKVLTI